MTQAMYPNPKSQYAGQYPTNYARYLERDKHEMLLACLKGGMSYEDAKEACSKEFDRRIEVAQTAFEDVYKAINEEMIKARAEVNTAPINEYAKRKWWQFW